MASVAAAAAIASRAHADARRFTYIYEADTMPVGTSEYEQWVTWKADKGIDPDFQRFDFRHEIEFGVTTNLQVAFYFSDWRCQTGDTVDDGAEWRNVAVELIYNLSDPVTKALGAALYGELKVGDELVELEAKLIVQLNAGSWVWAWNGTLEAEWEGQGLDERKGKLEQTFGGSYQLVPRLLAGFELLHEVEYDDWSQWSDHAVYLGPNLSFRTVNWWITITPLFQLTDVDEEPNFQTRVIFGISF